MNKKTYKKLKHENDFTIKTRVNEKYKMKQIKIYKTKKRKQK